MKPLTTKQRFFCEEYMKTFNGTQAAINAGYSQKTADRIASQNLRKLEVQQYLTQLKNEASERNKIKVDELIQELKAHAFFNIKSLFDQKGNLKPIQDLPQEISKCIETMDLKIYYNKEGQIIEKRIKIKPIDKLQAIEKLMRHLGAYDKDNAQANENIDKMVIEIVR